MNPKKKKKSSHLDSPNANIKPKQTPKKQRQPNSAWVSTAVTDSCMVLNPIHDTMKCMRPTSSPLRYARKFSLPSSSFQNPPAQGKMTKLFCAIVGVRGSAFPVVIAEDASVSALKKAIAVDQKYDFAASKLQLFLAKTADGGWLRSDDPDVISMRSGDIPEQVKKLLNGEIDPAEEIGDLFGGAPTKKTIHVLVKARAGTGGERELESIRTHDALTRIQEDNVRYWHNMAEQYRKRGIVGKRKKIANGIVGKRNNIANSPENLREL
ncbi:hypothetical protein P3T76_011942 [Phytophthora citrophthora]|uniref:Crinkler effector protein N-terminal domain-containing protein n=1 Tax=Phytophthora citrophthora TaxID=4793 RepID=A0AAD9LEM8_9STRA|nr:hypothetical protein P3T76_011942 [Phytophthora citrophthora]